jgi:hypothetical protein
MNQCPHCKYEYETEWKKKPQGGSEEVFVKGDEKIKQILFYIGTPGESSSATTRAFVEPDNVFGDHKRVGIFGCPKCKFVFWEEIF